MLLVPAFLQGLLRKVVLDATITIPSPGLCSRAVHKQRVLDQDTFYWGTENTVYCKISSMRCDKVRDTCKEAHSGLNSHTQPNAPNSTHTHSEL